ncbi:GNAT family N-acetyltransferase [Microbacterium sp. GXF7504]
MPWLPDDFTPPVRIELGDAERHHLRQIRVTDVDLDMVAVMGSRERLFAIYGEAWGWPPAGMTHEQDREDLQYHEDEMASRSSYNYAFFDEHEQALLGCVYIDPTEADDADAVVSWWAVDGLVGTPVAAALDAFVPAWLERDWPFPRIRYGVE